MFPSVKRIEKVLGVSNEKAKLIRGIGVGTIDPMSFKSVKRWVAKCYNKPSNEELVMEAINEVLGAFGVEGIEGEYIDSYFYNIQASYCNRGDCYDQTIILCHKYNNFLLCSYTDYVTKNNLLEERY